MSVVSILLGIFKGLISAAAKVGPFVMAFVAGKKDAQHDEMQKQNKRFKRWEEIGSRPYRGARDVIKRMRDRTGR